jgi:hypothetical protein
MSVRKRIRNGWPTFQSNALHLRLLCSLSNRTGFGDLAARLGTATAGLGAFPHRRHVAELLALGGTCVTYFGTYGAKQMRKSRISGEQNYACLTNRRALMTKADALRHRLRVVGEALINAG